MDFDVLRKELFVRLCSLMAVLVVVLWGMPLQSLAADLPRQVKLQYVDEHGLPVMMTFEQADGHYSVTTTINMLFYQMQFVSAGDVQQGRLMPRQYRDIRSGRIYAQAVFDGRMVEYGKAGDSVKSRQMEGAVYDVFTLAWQLALNKQELSVAHTYLTNGKKIYPLDGIVFKGNDYFVMNNHQLAVNRYQLRRGGTVIDYSFIPSLGNIPAEISYTDNGKNYVLKLKTAWFDEKVI